jgi:hypothetical protein
VEKPFVIRWNIIGFAGGGAFFLSFLLGVFSNNLFATILLRAFLFGIVFALLGGGIAFILDRFIPQITGSTAGSAPAGMKGKNVDITLEGEGLERESDIEELGLDENGAGAKIDAYPRKAMSAQAAPPDVGEADVTFGQLSEPGLPSDGDQGEDTVLLDENALDQEAMPNDGDLITEQDVGAPLAQPGGGVVQTGEGKGGDDNDLDVLPDMSHFESSFSPVTSGGMVSDTETYDGFVSDSLKEKGLSEDPATYVKAVRTIIKRDEGKRK